MSWAEVKKLNSDLTTPLNIASLINHIDLIGSSYVGSAEEAAMLLETRGLYSHEVARTVVLDLLPAQEYLDSKLSASTGVGAWLAFIADIDNATLVACNDMNAIITSETAMTAIAASETAMTIIAASPAAMTILDTGNKTVPQMTSNTLPSGVVTASSNSASYPPWKVFDKLYGYNSWYSANGLSTNQWVEYEFPNPTLVYKVDVRGVDTVNCLKHYKIEYSMNNTDWVEVVDDTFPTFGDVVRTNMCMQSKATKYWRIWVYNTFASANVVVAEMQLYGREFV